MIPDEFELTFPMYVIRQGESWAGIEGDAPGQGKLLLNCVFTDLDLAERYIKQQGVKGTPLPLKTPKELADFARSLKPPAAGVIIDPLHSKQGSIGQRCITTEKLLRNLRV